MEAELHLHEANREREGGERWLARRPKEYLAVRTENCARSSTLTQLPKKCRLDVNEIFF